MMKRHFLRLFVGGRLRLYVTRFMSGPETSASACLHAGARAQKDPPWPAQKRSKRELRASSLQLWSLPYLTLWFTPSWLSASVKTSWNWLHYAGSPETT